MNVATLAAALIASWEGCRLVAYPDSGGVWTIGWGETNGITEDSPDITQEQADQMLESRLQIVAAQVEKLVKPPVELTDNQFGALVSITYNAGTAPLATGHLGTYVNQREFALAAGEFVKWDKEHVDGDLVESAGLLRRRKAESALFLS